MSSRRRKRRDSDRRVREDRIRALSRARTNQVPPAELVSLARSHFGNDRAFAFMQMNDLLAAGKELDNLEFLEAAGSRLSDPDVVAREFAMCVVSFFADREPQRVWQQLCAHVGRVGRESREFLGVTILEELLHHHFDTVFLTLQGAVAAGSRGLLDALSFSWFDRRGHNYSTAQQYLSSEGHSRGPGSPSNKPLKLPAANFSRA